MKVLDALNAVWGTMKSGLFVELLLGVLGLMLLRVAYRLQRTTANIDFSDLIVGKDDQVSLIKLMQFVGFIVATWVVVVYTVRGALTEWLFLSYFGVATGTQVANRLAHRSEKQHAEPYGPPYGPPPYTPGPPPYYGPGGQQGPFHGPHTRHEP